MSRLLELAKSGEPAAIASLLNQRLNPQGIYIRTNWKNGYLGILVEADPVPNQETTMAVIHQFLEELQLASGDIVKVYGRRLQQKTPTWYGEIELGSLSEDEEALSFGLIDWLSQGLEVGAKLPHHQASSQSASSLPVLQSSGRDGSVGSASTGGDRLGTYELRYLKFLLNNQESSLLPLSSIKEVLKIPIAEVLPVPHMPACVLGIYNCRGEMLWIVDLSLQLGVLTEENMMDGSQLALPELHLLSTIVVHSEQTSMGLVIARVVDIEAHHTGHLQTSQFEGLFPSYLSQFMQGYLTRSSLPVLDAPALMQDISLQVHRPN